MAQNKHLNKEKERITFVPYQADPLVEEADDDMLDFIARMQEAYAMMRTQQDYLLELYRADKVDDLNDAIDELTDRIANNNPEVQQNLIDLKKLRSYRNVDTDAVQAIITRQKEIYADIRGLVVHETGLPDEARLSHVENAAKAVSDKLHTTFGESPYTASQALEALNILTVDTETDKITARFPTELVHKGTTELWETYLAAVCVHSKMAIDLQAKKGDATREMVQEADTARKYAHDAATKEFVATLNLHPTDKWGFDQARELLALMRDQVLPHTDSTQTVASQQLVMSHLTNLEVVKALTSKSH